MWDGGVILGLISVIILLASIAAAIVTACWVRRKRIEIRRQLQSAAEAEKNANMEETRFLAAISHDIRTPMNAITGMVAIAERHRNDPKHVRECLEKISLASRHLLTVLDDALDVSKMESGRMVLNPEKFCLADLVLDLVDIIRTQVMSKNLSFNVSVHHVEHEFLYADALRLSQIYINILSNAVKYTPAGGSVTVDLTEEPVADRPETVCLTCVISDTGKGMSPKFQATMYERFSYAPDEPLAEAVGYGIGLPVTKQMVDLMGGTIECESAVGQGTKFTVRIHIPIAAQEDKMEEMLQMPPLKLLLVGRDISFLESAVGILRNLGAEVDCVSDENEALRRAAGQTEDATDAEQIVHRSPSGYRAVIVDWAMRDKNEVELIHELKYRVDEDTLLFVSAFDCVGIRDAAIEAGADGFLNKPFFRSSVYRQMNELLRFDEERLEPDDISIEDLEGIRVLIAEDDDMNWEMVQELLEMYGISASRAENGRACVEQMCAAREGSYDLILMDIQMPEMNGLDATRRIREDEREWVRTIPIIAMTADVFSEDAKACLAAGMDGHVEKPVDLKKLFREIRKARNAKY